MLRYRIDFTPAERHQLRTRTCWLTATAIQHVRARVLLLCDRGRSGPAWTDAEVATALGVAPNTVRRTRRQFAMKGIDGVLARRVSKRSLNRKLFDPKLKEAVFRVLHTPPRDYGFHRTTWRRKDLRIALLRDGVPIGKNYLDLIIRNAGYRVRHTRTVLTSNDPDYRSKVDAILAILQRLRPDERFFSIDEFGPVAIKQQGGRRLVGPHEHPTVPQVQRSKGTLIVTGALELSTNQVTHFYSTGKNTQEMVKLLNVLLRQYRRCRTLYLSWDAAGWHASKAYKVRVAEVNSAAFRRRRHTPVVKLAPLPSRAQFLNVIESVFSGLSGAVIQNSDYASLNEAQAAVDRHFAERNEHFRRHPKRAGDKIWGRERVPPAFREGQNCRNPKYR